MFMKPSSSVRIPRGNPLASASSVQALCSFAAAFSGPSFWKQDRSRMTPFQVPVLTSMKFFENSFCCAAARQDAASQRTIATGALRINDFTRPVGSELLLLCALQANRLLRACLDGCFVLCIRQVIQIDVHEVHLVARSLTESNPIL